MRNSLQLISCSKRSYRLAAIGSLLLLLSTGCKSIESNQPEIIQQSSSSTVENTSIEQQNSNENREEQQISPNEAKAQKSDEIDLDKLESSGIPDGTYIIKSVISSKCIAIPEASTISGARLQQLACNDSDAQSFNISRVLPDNAFRIENINSGKSVQVFARSVDNGGIIEQWDNNEDVSQQFAFESMGDNQYLIRSRLSDKVLEVKDSRLDDGAEIQQWEFKNAVNQLWYLIPKASNIPIP